ncbi:MAG: hypothetical protein AAF668_10605 [Pseudomonadota bacterium]
MKAAPTNTSSTEAAFKWAFALDSTTEGYDLIILINALWSFGADVPLAIPDGATVEAGEEEGVHPTFLAEVAPLDRSSFALLSSVGYRGPTALKRDQGDQSEEQLVAHA